MPPSCGSRRSCRRSRCAEQVPTTCVWSTVFAGTQATLLWQSSQTSLVLMWVGLLPLASVPLWHEEQVPMTCVWSTASDGTQATLL